MYVGTKSGGACLGILFQQEQLRPLSTDPGISIPVRTLPEYVLYLGLSLLGP